MLYTNIIIKSEIWMIHINEDGSKKGTDILKREIWVDGSREEIEENLYRYLIIACDYEYGVENSPGKGEIEYIRDKIMMAFGLRL